MVYDEVGQPIRRYALPTVSDVVRLSPDGGRALVLSSYLQPSTLRSQASVLELATGAVITLALSPDHWYDDRSLIRVDTPQRGDTSVVVVEPDDERVLRRTTLPVADGTRLMGIVVARGTPPPGAIVL